MKNLKKKLVALLLVMAIILPVIPVLAESVPMEGPKISPWAMGDITDSQFIGIMEISQETLAKDYTKPATQDELKKLKEQFEIKLSSTGMESKNEFKEEKVDEKLTRGKVLLDIYNILGKYDKNISGETEPIKYLAENKILRGKGTDYNLDDEVTLEEAFVFYVRAIKKFYADNDLGGKGVFYKIENKGNTVYLFGSIHLGDYKMYPINASRMNTFEEADELFVELNTQDSKMIQEVQGMQFRTDGKKLKDELGEELYKEYQEIATSLGMEESMYENLDGWAVLNQLLMIPTLTQNPISPIIGIDNYLITLANLSGKSIISLETVETQKETLKKFYGDNEDALLENIKEAIEIIKSEEKMAESLKGVDNLINIWNEGNEKALGTMFEEDESAKILTSARDPEMAKKIIDLLESKDKKTSFVLVGAGHYAPNGSVVDIIEKAGYIVENLNK